MVSSESSGLRNPKVVRFEIIFDPSHTLKYRIFRNDKEIDATATKLGARWVVWWTIRQLRKKRRPRVVVYEKVYDDTDYYA